MIFIGGAPRTGTTLLKGILCKDEQTFPVIRECTYLRFLLNAYAQGKLLWEQHTYDYFDDKRHFQQFNKEIIDKYFNHIYNRFGSDKILVHKHPALIQYFSELDELYPFQCKFIVMIRDPRDAISSHLKINRERGLNIKEATKQFVDPYSSFMTWYQGKWDADNVLFIKYEDLLLDTNKIMDQLRDFTGLELNVDPLSESWDSRRGSSEYASELDGKPIDKTNIGNYIFDLSDEEIDYIEKHRDEINKIFNDDVFFDVYEISNKIKDLDKDEAIEKIRNLYNNGNTNEILEVIENYINKFPEEVFFYKVASILNEEIGNIDKGLEFVNKGLELDPNDYVLYNCKGLLLHRLYDFDNALYYYNKSVELNPQFADGYNNISRIYKDRKEFDKAKEQSSIAISIDPSFKEAEYNLEESILNSVDVNYDEKVFCIGMNRTGTTSIGKALEILGYNVKREIKKQDERIFDSNNFDKIINYILKVSEEFDAFTHEPWNIYFKELDHKFPNAKFILTLRDEESWVNSFYNYFKKDHDNWAPFLLNVYGLKDINEVDDENYYLDKFRTHNQSVLNYFKGRDNLLVINVFENDGWDKLCKFLDKEKPDVNFPFVNKGVY